MRLDVVGGPFGKDGWQEYAQRLSRAESVILYHGTTDVFLENILDKGLLPRVFTNNSVYEDVVVSDRNLESHPDKVYLIHRGLIGFGGTNAVNKWGGSLIGFRVFIPDVSALGPDEDSKKDTWYESIAYEDSCTHIGSIQREQLLGFVRRTREGNIYHKLRDEPQGISKLGEEYLRALAGPDNF